MNDQSFPTYLTHVEIQELLRTGRRPQRPPSSTSSPEIEIILDKQAAAILEQYLSSLQTHTAPEATPREPRRFRKIWIPLILLPGVALSAVFSFIAFQNFEYLKDGQSTVRELEADEIRLNKLIEGLK